MEVYAAALWKPVYEQPSIRAWVGTSVRGYERAWVRRACARACVRRRVCARERAREVCATFDVANSARTCPCLTPSLTQRLTCQLREAMFGLEGERCASRYGTQSGLVDRNHLRAIVLRDLGDDAGVRT